MGIRTIKKAGEIVGYQAIAGAGRGPGTSAYFSVAKHGLGTAMLMAAKRNRELAAKRPLRLYSARAGNTGGIAGLRLQLQPSQSPEGVPVLYAVATWQSKHGRAVGRKASTQRHGLLGAVERVLKEREKGTGRPLGLTPRQVLNRMKRAYEAAP